MEIRLLEYFLAVVREQSISAGAESLHLSQPTLSRQLKDLEDELGKKLFIRSNRKITLTEDGIILRKRAEEILSLVNKTKEEIELSDKTLSGNIFIGAGETQGIRQIAKIIKKMQDKYPKICFHIRSGDKSSVLEELDRGLIDFALLFGKYDNTKYDGIPLLQVDEFGVMMRKDDALSKKDIIYPEDLLDKPLIISRQSTYDSNLSDLFNCSEDKLNIVATYNLLYNASIMVDEGIGYAICFDNIINVSGKSNLCFRPISVQVRPKMSLVWKKYQVFNRISETFLSLLSDK